jgi:hypothetical protein
MIILKLLFLFIGEFQEARRVQICFYDEQKQPVVLEYYWIDTNDTQKEYPIEMMHYDILQHQEIIVLYRSLKLVFQRDNGDLVFLSLHVEQPGRFNIIVKDGIFEKCKGRCVGYKEAVSPDVTVIAL